MDQEQKKSSYLTEDLRQNGLSRGVAEGSDKPVPVVQVFSVRGVEYAFMSLMLWFGAGALITALDTLIMGPVSFDALSYPVSVLVVSLPIFSWLFLRLRKSELIKPELRLEASKRRWSQITQLVTFLAVFFHLIALVYILVTKVGGGWNGSLPKTMGVILVNILVAGGILAYYWADEHKLVRQ